VLPKPRIAIVGETPICAALRRLAPVLGLEPTTAPGADDLAVVVGSHGRDEVPALQAALDAHASYVGLVASRKRGAAVLAELGAPDGAVETPAGLDLGAETPEEIALSILARVVQVRRATHTVPAPAPATAPAHHPGSCCH
jgi:xanthine dehydrogenase accessory factor